MESLREIQGKVEKAQAYLREHFNADAEEDHLLAPPTFVVAFPDVDKAMVCRRIYGQKMPITTVDYRLAFLQNGDVEWRGRFRFFDKAVSPIRIKKKGAD